MQFSFLFFFLCSRDMRELKIIQSKASENENILSPKKSRFLSKRATNILIAFGAKIVTFFKVEF